MNNPAKFPPRTSDAARTYEIAALYKFSPVRDVASTQARLKKLCEQWSITGVLLVAPEGLNGTIAGKAEAIAHALAGIRTEPGFETITHKTSFASDNPFRRLKVRVKKEIVTLGQPSVDPGKRVGTYVAPHDWNALIAEPDVILIDTRNSYEVGIGTFSGAIDPETRTFREFPEFIRNNLDPTKHRRVAMFCTGGIRCEKASNFMLGEGFSEVYHLQGGILNYLEQVPEEQSTWQGGCFVFDERVSVGHGLVVETARLCQSCNSPLTELSLQSSDFEEGVSCPSCLGSLSEKQKDSARERQKQVLFAQKRGMQHLGPRSAK